MTKQYCQYKAQEIRMEFAVLAAEAINKEEAARTIRMGEMFAQVWDGMTVRAY